MDTSSGPLALASQLTLAGSLTVYPLLFFLITPRTATPSRFDKSREAISAFHCTLVTCLSTYELCRRRDDWYPRPSSARPPIQLEDTQPDAGQGGAYDGAKLRIIQARSTLGNSITALETGYLLQDAVILVLAAWLRRQRTGGSTKAVFDGIRWRVLAWHHVGLASALGLLQWYIVRGSEKGILVITMLMMMNASTPVGTLHWYLYNFRRSWRLTILAVNTTYLATYGLCRVYLVYWILHVFGFHTGHSAIETFRRLRLPCQMGTSAIGITNTIWLILSLRQFKRRYLTGESWKKGL